jgi:hypothetical protein
MGIHHLPLALTLLCAAGAPSAYAQDPTSTADRFQTLTAAAEEAYGAGDYAGAVEKYLAAYEVIQTADVIYNVAYIYERHLGKPDLARTWYERILRDPAAKADLVTRSNERITAIDARAAVASTATTRLGEGTPTQSAPAPTPAPAPAPSRRPSAAPWALTGAGGALVIGGVAVGLVARGTNQDFLAGQGGIDGMRDLSSQGKTQAAVADALWITGAVAAVAGLGWGIAANTGPRPAAVTWDLRVLPAPGSVTLAARF